MSTSLPGTLQTYRYPSKLAARRASTIVDQRALLAALKRGDSSARADVFSLYESAVRRVLMRILRERQDVQDALQDTFVKVFNSASQVKDPMALKGWILKVATSVGLDEYRRRQRAREHRLCDHGYEPSASSAPPEVRRALRDAYRVLSILPQQEQQVFTLRYIDGLELEKIADACEISLATVKRRLGRAAVRFNTLARRQPALTEWVAADTRI